LFKVLPRLREEIARLRDVPQDAPIEEAKWTKLWKDTCCAELNTILEDTAWAWLLPWPDLRVDQVSLEYDPIRRYESLVRNIKSAGDVLNRWSNKYPHRLAELSNDEKEGWGTQVRLESVKRVAQHGEPAHYRIGLSASRFLYYLAIQARLDRREREMLTLRNECFENSLTGIINGESLLLPSVFAIHMAVVMPDRKALLRLRPHNAPMFPDAWECTVGEMMHGPKYTGEYPHFENGKPNLDLFLKSAAAEELDYDDARTSEFRLYGFAAEYATLAPKLIVVFTCRGKAETLRMKAKSTLTTDYGADAHVVDLTPEGVAAAIRKYSRWGPTSKLAMMLALLETESSEKGKQKLKKHVSRLVNS
jgi:hypothetical protein